jgi:hypothetical protein
MISLIIEWGLELLTPSLLEVHPQTGSAARSFTSRIIISLQQSLEELIRQESKAWDRRL